MVEGFYGAVSDGATVSKEPWMVPKYTASAGALTAGKWGNAGGTSTGGQSWAQSPAGTPSQGLASTGVGGTFAQGSWPGKMAPAWHRGFYGGEGIRTGGYA